MPELPDLQVFSHNLNKRFKGKKVKNITFHRSKKLNVSGDQLIKSLKNVTLQEVRREGKELVLIFENGEILSFHKIRDLAECIKTVLKDAEKKILKNHPDIIHGEIRDFLLIHHPDKKESPHGAPIIAKKIGSRKTYFTQEQELFK